MSSGLTLPLHPRLHGLPCHSDEWLRQHKEKAPTPPLHTHLAHLPPPPPPTDCSHYPLRRKPKFSRVCSGLQCSPSSHSGPAEAGSPHPLHPPTAHAGHVLRSVQKEELSAEAPTLAASVFTNNCGLSQPHKHFRGFVSIKGTILLNQLMKHLLAYNS